MNTPKRERPRRTHAGTVYQHTTGTPDSTNVAFYGAHGCAEVRLRCDQFFRSRAIHTPSLPGETLYNSMP